MPRWKNLALLPLVLVALLSLTPSHAVVTTVATGTVNVPQPYGPYGPESVKFVSGNCAKSAESRSGVTHAIVNVTGYKGKTLKVTPTTVGAEIPATLTGGGIRVAWYDDCTPVNWFKGSYSFKVATHAAPATIVINNQVALMIVAMAGINQGYKIECTNC